MAKRKSKNNLISGLMWIIAVIVSIAVGGSFVAGKFMDVIILNMLPLIVHQIVGWIIVGSTTLGAFATLFNFFK